MRRINGALIALAITGTVGALAYPVFYSYPHRNDAAKAGAVVTEAPTINTRWGPLTASDRDLIVRVRLAGLWELPAGQQALERAPSQAIKEAGEHLITGHNDLDKRVRIIAAQLGVELPNQPTAQQQGWLDEMTAAQGKDYEYKFANLLRAAHGKILPDIGTVRNSTRNSLVRQLASDTNNTVLDHITILEKTGAVDFNFIAENSMKGATASPSGPPAPVPGQQVPDPPAVTPPPGLNPTSGISPSPGGINTNRPEPEDPDGILQ
ncbi:DUF4142 domain-containing protein [Streptomyces cavernae]|uniref:DUF4142 domain-containing protein n=1 Tax=Streptomyces cavernae TaxID=2259034 RepID=UPI00192E5078|nr:DUF4142 domain-containing protein [Streptomyces cavernae]